MADDDLAQQSAASTEKAEPAISTGVVVGGATILLDGMILLGLPIGVDAKLYLLSAVTFLAPTIAGLIIRFKVWAPRSVARMVEAHKAQLAEARREADQQRAEAAAARAAVGAVKALVTPPPAQRPQRPPVAAAGTPGTQLPLPPSDRVYGLYGGQEPAVGRVPERTKVQPAVTPARKAGPPTEPENDGFYDFTPAELAEERAPRGYSRSSRRRHALRDDTPE